MNFLAPLALWWLALLPLIVLLYFLKLKRKNEMISSTYLWQRAIQDLRVNSPFQRLRRNLLLWLQLALLALLIVGLARPAMNLKERSGYRYICLIDTSASMAARDVRPDRLGAAQREAHRLVDNMSRDDQMLLMTFDVKPSVVVPMSGVKSLLHKAIDEIEVRETSTDFAPTLELITALVKEMPNVRLFVLSDGGFDTRALANAPEVDVTYLKVGVASENIGITALDARRSIEDWGRPQVFCRVENFGALSAEARLDLYLDGELFQARTLTIPPGETAVTVFADPNLNEGLVKAVLADEDDLDTDNAASLILVEPRALRTLLVTPGNYFLELALKQDPMCDQFFKSPEEYDEALEAGTLIMDDYDVVILDRHVPASLPSGAYLFLGCVPPLEEFGTTGEVETPVVLDWDTVHPVNQYVSYANLFLESALPLVAPVDAHTLVESDAGPLILWWASPTYDVVVVGFDLFASRWPLRPGFPVFLANALRHLGGMQSSGGESMIRPGKVITFAAPGRSSMDVKLPTGDKKTLPVESDRVSFGDTVQCGLYVFDPEREDDARTYVVNLMDSRESNTAPRDEIPWHKATVAGTTSAFKENREIWPWLVFVAFCILVAEWYIYNRRVYL